MADTRRRSFAKRIYVLSAALDAGCEFLVGWRCSDCSRLTHDATLSQASVNALVVFMLSITLLKAFPGLLGNWCVVRGHTATTRT